MTTSQKMIDHLADLERAREEAYAEGNRQRVDTLQLCIDDTRSDIAKFGGEAKVESWMMTAIVPEKTLDLIDAIENRGLVAIWIEGAVGCIIPKGSDMEGLPKAACLVQYFPRSQSYKVWWPDHPWTEPVQDYVDMIHDESGVADATQE